MGYKNLHHKQGSKEPDFDGSVNVDKASEAAEELENNRSDKGDYPKHLLGDYQVHARNLKTNETYKSGGFKTPEHALGSVMESMGSRRPKGSGVEKYEIVHEPTKKVVFRYHARSGE